MPESDWITAEIDLASVKRRAVKSVAALSGRTFFLQAISFFGFFLLTIFLGKGEIGLFFAISELVGLLGYFSDIGLAAALIQKKEQPQKTEIRSTFTVQQVLVLTLVALVFIFTPFLKQFYNISQTGVFLLWAFAASFFFSSLKTIPSILLERHLRFDKLVIVDIVEAFLFNGIAVVLAWRGLGVTSYTAAVLIRSLAGVILIYIFSPWPIGIAFDRDSLKKLLSFGVAYQANTFLAVIKDRLMNIFLWKIIGAEGVGILGWAQKWAQTPLRFVMDSVMKVTFPAYSRMQDHPEELKKAIEKTIFFIAFLVFPSLLGLLILAKPLVEIIPKYGKWEVALFALYFYGVNSAWGAITTPLTNALTAIGRIKTVFKLMVMWTVLTWVLFPILAVKFGYNGVAVAAALVATSSIVAIWLTKKTIDFSLWSSIKIPLLATIIMGVVLLILIPFLAHNILGVIILVFVGIIVYFSLVYLIMGQAFLEDVKKIISTIQAG